MPEKLTLRGTILKVFHASPEFSAGLFKPEEGAAIKFRGRLCANVGDRVALVGHIVADPKYGQQFNVEQLSYALPDSPDGLVRYLAGHKAFGGIGKAMARKLVDQVETAAGLELALAGDLSLLRQAAKVPLAVLENLKAQWQKSSSENAVRTFLSSFGLTEHQMDTLLQAYGEAIVGILKANPYQLISQIDGYGFKRVDQIAQSMGIPKDHPGRIDAALVYALGAQVQEGHTWTGGADLVNEAEKLLLLDSLDGRAQIKQRGSALLESGRMIADGAGVTFAGLRDAERAIRQALENSQAAAAPLQPEAGYHADLKDAQVQAYGLALRHPISVISGGAGTGKTFVVSRLAKAFHSLGFNVALCAPTGKAAKRIEEVLSRFGVDLGAKTLHRLMHSNGMEFQRPSLSEPYAMGSKKDDDDETEKVLPAYDAIIVDEVSMVDVPLMNELISRIDFNKTRLVLVGDHNQLPPVGPGNVLRDIIQHQLAPTVVLQEVVRQAGTLKANCTALLAGRVVPTASTRDEGWQVIDGFAQPEQIQVYLRDLILSHIPDQYGFDPLREVQLITPQHKGLLGTQSLNKMMQLLMHGDTHDAFVVGDKVIQTQNDYGLGVMNGSIGFVTDVSKNGMGVLFEGEGHKVIEGEKIDRLQLAYALTAHKTQGSEFPCAIVLCHKSHYFADRNWLYTACTRAAKACFIVGDRWGIQNAAKKNNVIHRRTLLSKWSADTK